jgi:hypothetical protein
MVQFASGRAVEAPDEAVALDRVPAYDLAYCHSDERLCTQCLIEKLAGLPFSKAGTGLQLRFGPFELG